MEALLTVAIFGSFFGFLYPLAVGTALGLCVLARRGFRPRAGQWLPLLAPAAIYYFLAFLVSGRQGWNLPYAVLGVTGFGVAVVLAACVARRASWLRIGAAAGVVLAFVLWRAVPYQGWTRLF
jgi:hypothetical protein